MKNKKFVVGLLLLMIGAMAFAKTSTQHAIGGYALGGYHTELLPNNTQLARPNGWEAGLGFDYRFTAGQRRSAAKFLLNTGVGVSFRGCTIGSDATEISLPHSFDSDAYEFTYIYQLSNRKDQYSRLGVVVPLMVGAEFKRLYFTVGAKVNVALWAQAKTQLNVAAYGDYPQFLDPFTSMPEHQFFDARDIQSKQKIAMSSDLLASVEVGYQVHKYVRIAAFADYGLLSFGGNMASDKPAITTPQIFSDQEDMFSPIKVNHALSTTLVGDGKVTPLTAGVRVLVSVPYSVSKYPCHCMP